MQTEKKTQIERRELGSSGLIVSAMGLGCMGMSEFYGQTSEQESINTIKHAIEMGISFLDTADIYGRGHNEELIGKAIHYRRNQVQLATKFGIVRGNNSQKMTISGKPEYVISACEESLYRLNVDVIDLYYFHRVDPQVPIEETVHAMASLVKQGKVKHIGLSEVSARTLRKAYSVHPIAAVQSEYSLWCLDPEAEIIQTCRELKVGFVAYSPLGRGFLTGKINSLNELDQNDFRRTDPRFKEENLGHNLDMVKEIEKIAAEKECTASQIALAWLLAQGSDIVPIPGTRKITRLEENIGALNIKLTEADLKKLNQIAHFNIKGNRYSEEMMGLINQ